jgi:hypothetical protein
LLLELGYRNARRTIVTAEEGPRRDGGRNRPWLPTLNFPASRQAVLERKYLERLLALLPPPQDLLALGEDIRSDLVTGIWGPSKIPFQVS